MSLERFKRYRKQFQLPGKYFSKFDYTTPLSTSELNHRRAQAKTAAWGLVLAAIVSFTAFIFSIEAIIRLHDANIILLLFLIVGTVAVICGILIKALLLSECVRLYRRLPVKYYTDIHEWVESNDALKAYLVKVVSDRGARSLTIMEYLAWGESLERWEKHCENLAGQETKAKLYVKLGGASL